MEKEKEEKATSTAAILEQRIRGLSANSIQILLSIKMVLQKNLENTCRSCVLAVLALAQETRREIKVIVSGAGWQQAAFSRQRTMEDEGGRTTGDGDEQKKNL